MTGKREEPTGRIHSKETFGLVDGPGVRFVLFLQGCRMRCRYCHNPETWSLQGGEEQTAEEVFRQMYRYKNYWGKNGGITVSGGEPLLQIEFVTRLFQLAKEKGVHTALDTAGNPFTREEPFFGKFRQLMGFTDLVMLDFKEFDPQKHRELTGVGNENIVDMARFLSEEGIPLWIRHVLVPGLTDEEQGLRQMARLIGELKTVEKVEVLPYHTLGLFKWQKLGIPYSLEGVSPPSQEQVERAKKLLWPGGPGSVS